MKRLLVILASVLLLAGCVYSREPYGYSRSVIITTPAYPRYQHEYHPHYAPPPPKPRYYYEYRRSHPHFRQHQRYRSY